MDEQTAAGLTGAPTTESRAFASSLRMPVAPVVVASVVTYALAIVGTGVLAQTFGAATRWPQHRSLTVVGLVAVVAIGAARLRVRRAAWLLAVLLTAVGCGALVLLATGTLPIRPYGDGAIFAEFVAAGRAMPRWLVGSAAASVTHAALWQFPPLRELLAEPLRSPAAFLAVLGTATMVVGTWGLFRRWPGRLAVLLPAMTPVWVLFTSGYAEYYPLVAVGFLAALAWLFERPLEQRTGYEVGTLAALLALGYVGFVPTALAALLMFALVHRAEAGRALCAALAVGAVTVATCWPEGMTHYIRALYSVINLGDAHLVPRYAGQVASPTSMFFGAGATLSWSHTRDVAYGFVWGAGWWSLPLLGAAAWSWRDAPGAVRQVHRDARTWLAVALLTWHLAYAALMVPRLGPMADIDLFFPTYLVVPFLAGLLIDLRPEGHGSRRSVVIAFALGALVMTAPALVWFGLPAAP